MSDWRAAESARAAARKRTELESIERAITEVEGYLAEARSFEGYYSEQIAAVDRQIGGIAFLIGTDSAGSPFIAQRPNEAGLAEVDRLRGVRGALERERDQHKAAKTIESEGQFGQKHSHCLLSSDDMIRRRAHLVIVRDRVADELRDLEAKCSPGELVQAGTPAPDYAEYVRKTEALRYGPGVVARFGAPS